MKNTLKKLTCVGAFISLASHSGAVTIFSEDFSSLTGPVLASSTTERYAVTDLLYPITLPSWTIEGDSPGSFAHLGERDSVTGNLSLLINEIGTLNNGISQTITGLLIGQVHTLSFEYWGDNELGTYSFNYEIDGVTTPVTNTLVATGTGNFNTISFNFTPTTATTTLRFTETQTGVALSSPVLDNILITAVPEPSALGLLGLGGVAALGLRRRRA
jgi:PEP-CTERM motif